MLVSHLFHGCLTSHRNFLLRSKLYKNASYSTIFNIFSCYNIVTPGFIYQLFKWLTQSTFISNPPIERKKEKLINHQKSILLIISNCTTPDEFSSKTTCFNELYLKKVTWNHLNDIHFLTPLLCKFIQVVWHFDFMKIHP